MPIYDNFELYGQNTTGNTRKLAGGENEMAKGRGDKPVNPTFPAPHARTG